MNSKIDHLSESNPNSSGPLKVTVTSFGYKEALPPQSHMVFDVRFLKNPYWIPELRPLTGLDPSVREYVLKQDPAVAFLDSLVKLVAAVLPQFEELGIYELNIALGCTGGQHRSVSLVESLAEKISELYPNYHVCRQHRELGLEGVGSSGTKAACEP